MNINWKYLTQSAAAFALTVCGMVVELPAAMANSVTDSVPVHGRIWVSIGFWAAGYIVHHVAISTKIQAAPDSTAIDPVSTQGMTATQVASKGPLSGGGYTGGAKP